MLTRAVAAPGYVLAALCALALSLVLAPASASALNHGFTSSFGSAGTGSGEFSNPSGVAVNEVTSGDVGDVYVVDKGNNRVEQFSSTGAFVLMFGKEVNKTKVEAAAPEAEQNVCTAASGNACKAGTEGSGPGEFSSPEGIAVDNSGSAGDPSDGDVYVVNTAGGDNTISKFNAEGAYLGVLSEAPSGTPFVALASIRQ
jgi:tripartite motif-containing protein 71